MKYCVYEINLCDEATLQCAFPGDELGYEKAKRMRELLYNVQERCMKDGEQFERMRYVIIND